jgi:hypothetical protein
MDNIKKTYEPYIKVYVDCCYEQKEYAKSKGFKFDYNKKMWYLKIKFDNNYTLEDYNLFSFKSKDVILVSPLKLDKDEYIKVITKFNNIFKKEYKRNEEDFDYSGCDDYCDLEFDEKGHPIFK